MQTDERALMHQIARGEAHALRRLYEAYHPLLWRYLWQQLEGDEQGVEDALQEIFLSVWRFAQGFRGEAQVKTWVFRIAHHYVAHFRRAMRHRPEQYLASPAHDADEESDCGTGAEFVTLQTGYASHEDVILERITLGAAISRLSAKHREALELVFQQGFTLEEAAQILDVPTGTVKSRISYARRALQRELASLEAEGSSSSRGAAQ